MKALFTAAVAGLAGVTAMMPAEAGTYSAGNSMARDCWEAAVGRDYDRNAFYHCNMALDEEGLDAQNRAATLVNRGVLYMRNNNHTAARRDFDRAIATDSRNGEAWLNMAISRLRQNESAAALPMIEKALALNTKEQALAYYSRAIVYERAGNLRGAYADLQRARDLAPNWKEPAEDLKRYSVRRR